MDYKQSIVFPATGLNSDDSYDIMPQGDSPTSYGSSGRVNVIVPPDNFGRLEDAWGTTKIAASDLAHTASVTSLKLMGSVLDTDKTYAYYFLYGTTGINSLIRVKLSDGGIIKVLFDETVLEMDSAIVFKEACYLDGWIYYSAGQYGAKKINATRAINFTAYKNSAWDVTDSYSANYKVLYTNGGIYKANASVSAGEDPPDTNSKWDLDSYAYPNTANAGVASLTAGAFDLVYMPPLTRVTGIYGNDTAVRVNNLRGNTFQFTYRYKYRDGGYSVTAPFSSLFLPPNVESYKGEVLNSITTNNKLDLRFDGGSAIEVEYVELFVRMGEEISWQYVDKVAGGTDTYTFYNDKLLEVVSDAIVNKLADAIPKETRAVELLSENVLALGGNTYGFDNITPNVALTVNWEKATLNSVSATLRQDYTIWTQIVEYDPNPPHEPTYYNEIVIQTIAGISAGDVLYIRLDYSTFSVIITYTLEAADIASMTALRNKCISLINIEGTPCYAAYSAPPSGMTLTNGDFYVSVEGRDNTLNTTTSYVSVYAPGAATMNKWSQFTTGAKHPFGITYYDRAMRPFAIAYNTTTEVYVPTVPEAKAVGDNYEWRNNISWEILHEAPAEAAYYQWFYGGNRNIDDFWFYVIDSATVNGEYVDIVITSLQTVQTTFPLSQVGPYVWQKGDRLRGITEAAASGAYGTLVDTDSDVEIYDSTLAAGVTTIRVAKPASGTYELGVHSLVEIYRPKAAVNEDLFFAFSPIYETYTSTTHYYHRGSVQDQTGTTSGTGAKGAFLEGDSYVIARAFDVVLTGGSAITTLYLVESPAYSDFYDSKWWSEGKINIRSNIGEVTLNNIAYSNRFIQDTGINGLSTFDALDIVSLSDKWGKVIGLKQIGNVLRVIQQRKRTSFYVGMTEVMTQTGESMLTKFDGILGNRRELDGDWGCEHPETICRVGDMLYYLDINNAAFIQDSENGAFPISDNKMSAWFIGLRDEYGGSAGNDYLFYVDYNPDLKTLYLLRYIEGNGVYVLMYHLPQNRWIGTLDDSASMSALLTGFIHGKNKFYWVNNGVLYSQTEASTRRTYLAAAAKATATIRVIDNHNPLEIKVFDTVGVHSNQHTGWAVNDITIPATQTTTVNALSKVLSTDWITREGITRAPIKRNLYTTGVSLPINLFEGERMRGNLAIVTFTLPSPTTGAVEVLAFEVGSSVSK